MEGEVLGTGLWKRKRLMAKFFRPKASSILTLSGKS